MSRTPEVSPAWLRLIFVVGISLLPLFSRAQSSSDRGQPSKFAKDFPNFDLYEELQMPPQDPRPKRRSVR